MVFAQPMEEGLIIPGRIRLPFSFTAGKTGSRFLIELRDRRRIMGVRCPSCGRVGVPPQKICIFCFVETDRWVEVSTEGTLMGHTWVRKPKAHHPPVDPLIYGLIRLDGADGHMVHLVHTNNPGHLVDGIRVAAVFSENRRAHILDIMHFRPL